MLDLMILLNYFDKSAQTYNFTIPSLFLVDFKIHYIVYLKDLKSSIIDNYEIHA